MKSIQCFLLFFLFLFGSCDYLDVVPEEDLETIESVFEKREKADQWLYTAYNYLMPLAKVNQNPAFLGADEYTTGNYLRNQNGGMAGLFIGDGLQMSQDPYGDLWESGYYNGIVIAIRLSIILMELTIWNPLKRFNGRRKLRL